MNKGISLAELVMTCVLLVVVSCIGYMSLSNTIEQQSAKTSIGKVAYALQTAKHYARTKGVITTISLSNGSTSFDILANGQSITNEANFDSTSGNLPDNTEIVLTSCYDIGFNIDGSLVDSYGYPIYYDCTITVGYDGGPQETITIKGKTGQIEYEQ